MIITLKTGIAFQPRTKEKTGETIHVRDGVGRVVETWECLSKTVGNVTFDAVGYRAASEI